MKHLLFSTLLLFAFATTNAQTPTLKKYDIGTSGCQVYLHAEPEFQMDLSSDSSEVWTGEIENDGLNYAVICVRLKAEIEGGEPELTGLLENYMDFLKDQFVVLSATGYAEGRRLGEYPGVYGVLDYWEDMDDMQYTVMGWANNKYLVVMMVYGIEDAEYAQYNTFFEGMRFPE
ncbi:MAG: hypothetical protein SH857_01745 [Chitinophagales bacterium]|nr:hypothetical protein [Chitinophagales bacterium]